MIEKGLPMFKYKPPKSEWNKYLNRNGNYNSEDKIKVKLKKRLYDIEEDKHYKYGEEVYMKKWRVSELECQNIVERI
jgi:hypothetical protein